MHGLVVMFSLAVCTVIAVFTSRSGSIEPFFVSENFGPIPEYESAKVQLRQQAAKQVRKSEEGERNELKAENKNDQRWIFVITPTYRRSTQRLDLVRLFNTLGHIQNLHLIIVEDAKATSKKVSDMFDMGLVHHWSHSNMASTPNLKVNANLAIRAVLSPQLVTWCRCAAPSSGTRPSGFSAIWS